MTEYEKILAEDRRLVILRFLSEIPGNQTNESIIETSLKQIGHKATRCNIRADIDFLVETGCVTTQWYADTVIVATLTRKGKYVAEGLQFVSGIKAPSL